MKVFLRNIKFAILILVTLKCANQLPPPGGPVDNEPPQILDIYPQDGALNFDDDHFEVTFSEYIEKLSLLDAFFISPEVKNISYDWSGTSVEITFDDTLKENTTYTVSIGSSVQDLNNKNNMLEAVNFAFSTGSKLDVGIISGKINDKNPSGVMIFAYMQTDTFANPLVLKPKNTSQVGDNGEYKSLGLANGTYRVFAVKEENKNRIYNVGEDMFGAPHREVIISDSNSSVIDLNFRLTKEDTTAPYISSVTMTDQNHILLEYSEFIDSSRVGAENFYLIDSLTSKITKTIHFFRPNLTKAEYFITISDSLNEDGKYFIVAEKIFDRFENIKFIDQYEFVVSVEPDTIAPSLKNVETGFEKNQIDYIHPNFKLNFSDGLTSLDFANSISLKSGKQLYSFNIAKFDDASYEVTIPNKLLPNKEIQLAINNSGIVDAANNQLDSVITKSLTTLSGREFSGISGSVQIENSDQKIIVVLESTERKGNDYWATVQDDKTYNIERVLPGKYLIWCYLDLDDNNEFNYGAVEPFEFSEKFYTYPDTLNLRARWPIGDVLISD